MTASVPNNGRALRWVLIVVGLLLGHIVLMMWAMVKATGDPNFIVIPNYYEKAVNWDQEQARRRASAQLGWKIALEVTDQKDALNRRRAIFRLTDGENAPVAVDQIKIDGFHDADASRRFAVTPSASSPGVFEVDLPLMRGGFYQFEVEARLGSLQFAERWRQYIAAPAQAGAK